MPGGTDKSTALLVSTIAHFPPRVVLDTNAGLALFAYADPCCGALAAALRERRVQAVANAATRGEWLGVLWRDGLRLDQASRQRAAQSFDALVMVMDACVNLARTRIVLPRCRDPDDQIFLELARDAGCVALFTRDRQLLKLASRTQRAAGFVVRRPEDCPG